MKNLRCLFKNFIAPKCLQFRFPQEKSEFSMIGKIPVLLNVGLCLKRVYV